VGGFVLVVLLIITGGVIAFIGDRIGMKIGKKRLTLLGMRPRYTSMIITVFTGVVIAAASVTVMSIVSEDVRTALFHMKEVKQALATSESRYEESQRLLEDAEDLLIEQQLRVESLRSEVTVKAQELSFMEEQRNEAMRELEEARQERAIVIQQLQDIQSAYLQAKQDLATTEKDLEFEKERVENLKDASEMIQAKVRELQERETLLETKIVNLLEQYQKLDEAYQRFNEQMRYGHLAFKANEIVFAQVMEGGKGQDAAQLDLVQFLLRANQVALGRGARIEGKDNYAIMLYSEEHFDQVVRVLGEESGQYVVRAVAHGNTVLGEGVVVWFDIKPRQKVFQKGEVLASVKVLGGDTQNIEDVILSLLRQVNELAIAKGMVTDTEGRVGQTSGEEFFKAIAAVRDSEGTLIVNAVAQHDTWNTGKLQIELVVAETKGNE
jgi:uncharacterized protein (DUF3084 family)